MPNRCASAFGTGSVEPRSKAVDVNFIDIAEKLSSFPMAFNGRFEAHYDRFGLYLDGNYADLTFENQAIPIGVAEVGPSSQLGPGGPAGSGGSGGPHGVAEVGLSTQMGIMDYGLTYRIAGPVPNEPANWVGKKLPNRLDLYVGGRTLWLANTLDPKRLDQQSASATLTAPLIGGRFIVDITPDWFVLADGNLGGFGVDDVSFTGGLEGLVGYRATLFEVPTLVELGYRAIRVNAHHGRLEANTTLNGPFAGMTVFW